MCQICLQSLTQIDYLIESKDETLEICPNCLTKKIIEKTLNIPDGTYISEISNETNAVKINDGLPGSKPFFVTPDEAKRLFAHALRPNEVKALLNNHTLDEYLLHGDFYDDNFVMQQPHIY